MKGRRTVWSVALLLLGGYGLVCLAVYLLQASLLFHPGPAPIALPSSSGFEYLDVELHPEPGVVLHGWSLPVAEERGAVLVCHGNAGNIAGRLAHARAFQALGYSVLLFDWRGFGKSTGTPTEQGTYADAEAAWAWLLENGRTPADIVIYGESLGGAVAVELATRHQPKALITEATFTSTADVGRRAFPWLPVGLLLVHRYESLQKAPRIRAPWLLLHSPDDELVPYEHAGELRAAAGGPAEHLATAGGHNDGGFLQRESWRGAVGAFLRALP